MRFMLIEKAEAGAAAWLALERARFEQALVRAGVLLAAERLAPIEGAGGPALAGFWLIEVKSKEEAHEWARRAGAGARIDIRQVAHPEETGHAVSHPELRR